MVVFISNTCCVDSPATCDVVNACNCTELNMATLLDVNCSRSDVSNTAICLVVNALSVVVVKFSAWSVVNAAICAVVKLPTVLILAMAVVFKAATVAVLKPEV